MVDAVIFLEHHEAFVTLECALDALDAVSHLCLDVALFSLQFISSLIKRENQEIECEA